MSKEVRPPSERLATLRTLTPGPAGIYAYYDGRVGGRLVSPSYNVIDDGAFVLGVCTYAIISGTEALLYDAGITPEHAAFMLDHVKSLGATKVIVVYSHFHDDHIAGAVALKDGGLDEIIAHVKTERELKEGKEELGKGIPPIEVVLPTRMYEESLTLQVGSRIVKILNFNIHTKDGTVLFLPEEGLLFAGDTLEDTATYIGDAGNLSTHQEELKRMAQLPIKKILPAHGSPDRIASGGYDPSLIDATVRYIQAVDESVPEPKAWKLRLEEVVAADVEAGNLIFFGEYEEVHRSNVKCIQDFRSKGHQLDD
ncbi:Metallo-hydrolase/oxidoreductase [Lentithecium fluviatile CBS 122367]|uniref:Metallo-hydrolase/oxidoreductase n=1 Tax=Lentithecium fluviatile CBS 122367 TaxID=1168545 RepID=A0A6G1J7A7_9PLEO|nr:Metallo-hydrolase/oxidoreductase [Lentithecium fluviatile CBS 122367]